MEFIILFVGLAIGTIYGWNLRERHATRYLNKILTDTEKRIRESAKDMIHIIIEKDKDTLFVYHKENHKFITQANTRDELEKKLTELFPGKRFACNESNLKEVGFHNESF